MASFSITKQIFLFVFVCGSAAIRGGVPIESDCSTDYLTGTLFRQCAKLYGVLELAKRSDPMAILARLKSNKLDTVQEDYCQEPNLGKMRGAIQCYEEGSQHCWGQSPSDSGVDLQGMVDYLCETRDDIDFSCLENEQISTQMLHCMLTSDGFLQLFSNMSKGTRLQSVCAILEVSQECAVEVSSQNHCPLETTQFLYNLVDLLTPRLCKRGDKVVRNRAYDEM